MVNCTRSTPWKWGMELLIVDRIDGNSLCCRTFSKTFGSLSRWHQLLFLFPVQYFIKIWIDKIWSYAMVFMLAVCICYWYIFFFNKFVSLLNSYQYFLEYQGGTFSMVIWCIFFITFLQYWSIICYLLVLVHFLIW